MVSCRFTLDQAVPIPKVSAVTRAVKTRDYGESSVGPKRMAGSPQALSAGAIGGPRPPYGNVATGLETKNNGSMPPGM